MRTLFFLVSVLWVGSAYALQDIKSDSLKGTAIAMNAYKTVNGSRYANPIPASRTFWIESSYGLVKLSYPLPSSAVARPGGQKASVTLAIQYKIEENGSYTTKNTTATLALDLEAGTAADVSYFKAQGAQSITATVQSVTIPSGWTNLKLEVSVVTESFDFLNTSDISALNFNVPVLTADKNLQVSWNALPAAASYDLEWTYVSDQSEVYGHRLPADSVPVDRFLFRNNSTRVSVAGLSYNIPLIYEAGLILYRIRGAGKNTIGNSIILLKTEWTVPDGTLSTAGDYALSSGLYTFNGLEQNLNWQSSVSFAEEGKNKAVVSYHDGSSRNRQAVTRINSDQRSVVGETLYDYNGRPVIQALPVPVVENKFTYYPNFNITDTKTLISKLDYDTAHSGSGCAPLSPAFSTGNGASQYYSALNPFDTAGNTGTSLLNKNLIPNAQKYPYTQTSYTPDNTGRIAAQSGVGITHRIGTGHETRYLYGIPQQPELARLFGGQAGYAAHYKKNVVIDANGQSSVSYLDLDGKVVATALAGDSGILHNLPGSHSRTINVANLLSPASNLVTVDGLGKNFTTKFTVTGNNIQYKFEYKAILGSFGVTCSNGQPSNPPVSLDEAVDVELLLQDKCGVVVFDASDSTRKGYTGASQTVDIPKQATLKQGEYLLTKTLKINDAKLEAYWNKYLTDAGTCLLTQDYFVNSALQSIDTTGCNLNCANCQALVNKVIGSRSDLTSDQIATILSACDGLCDNNDITCLSSLQAMLGDVSPGGQYGELRKNKVNQASMPQATFDANNLPQVTTPDITLVSNNNGFDAGDPSDSDVDASPFPLSVFNTDNRLLIPAYLQSLGQPVSWQNPVQVTKKNFKGTNLHNEVLQSGTSLDTILSYSITEYKDAAGDTAFTNIYRLFDATGLLYYQPAISNVSMLQPVDTATGLYRIPVRYLQNLADFERLWQSQWANYLVVYHPEFRYFLECTGNNPSNAFDYNISITDFSQAVDSGYIGTDNIPTLISATPASSKDPLALSNHLYYLFQKKRNDLYQSLSGINYTMAQIATITVNCPAYPSGCAAANCQDGKISSDEEWETYRGFYLAEKEAFRRTISQTRAVAGDYYNGCIGHSDFLFNAPDAALFRQQETVSQDVTYTSCTKHWYNPFKWGKVCKDITYKQVHTFPYYMDPSELCFTGRAGDYQDRTQRFFPEGPSGSGGGEPAARCSTLVDDGAGNILQVSMSCTADIQQGLQDATTEAQRFKYTSCGQCPLAADVELFLMDLTAADSLLRTQGGMLVSCDLDQYQVHIGEALRGELLSGGVPWDAYWSSGVSAGNKVLTGKIYKGSNVYATISLHIPDSISTTFATLDKLCCLSPAGSGSYFPTVPGENFNLTGYFKDHSILSAGDHSFPVEGQITLNISSCTIAPTCLLSADASNTALLLNTLIQTSAQKPSQLIAPTPVALDTGVNKVFYDYPVREITGKDDQDVYNGYVDDISSLQPVWKSSVQTGDVISGTFTYNDNGNVKNIYIEVSGLSSAQFSQLTEFSNLRTGVNIASNDVCRIQPCEKQTFAADAVIITNNQKQYIPITIYVPSLNPVICQPALPPANQN